MEQVLEQPAEKDSDFVAYLGNAARQEGAPLTLGKRSFPRPA
jgi:hypothetical protein